MTRSERGATYALRGREMIQQLQNFVERNARTRARIEHYREVVPRQATLPRETFANAVGDLELQQEELSVAEEELRVQTDALAEARRAAERERLRYRELFEIAPDAYVVTDTYGLVVEANEEATRLLGLERRFLRRKPLAAFVQPEHVGLLRHALSGIEDKRAFTLEVPIKPRKGGPMWVELNAHVSREGDRILWLARDVSARRQRTESLKQEQAALELRVQERTEELSRALRDKDELLARERSLRAELQTANNAKDRFIAVLSHDLRGPLNAVLGWAGLLRREPMNKAARDKALATIERNALAQTALIDGLLDVARIGAGKLQFDMRLVDFADLVRMGIEAVLPAALEREVAFVDATATVSSIVLGDPGRLRQVIANLLTNALKFTPPGGRVVVSLANVDGVARLVVSDTGRGIDAATLPHVFECFRQADENGGLGLGLGLFIVRQLVQMHDGHVEAWSEGAGRGTVFEVTLPLRDASMTVLAPSPSEASIASMKPAAGELGGYRILLVDDDDDTREVMAAVLAEYGASVVTAADARTALATFASDPPDVLVSDLGLPEMDGQTLMRQIRRARGGQDIVAVAVSGFATSDDARRAIDAGFDVHVAKPVSSQDLVKAIQNVIRNRAADA